MRSLFRPLARLLLAIMLATVLAPGFGWEAAGGAEAHDLSALVAMADAHDGHAMHDGHPSHQADAAAADCQDVSHHCCPGHVLGHLSGCLNGGLSLPQAAADVAVDGVDPRFSSRIPEGLERPPRAVAA